MRHSFQNLERERLGITACVLTALIGAYWFALYHRPTVLFWIGALWTIVGHWMERRPWMFRGTASEMHAHFVRKPPSAVSRTLLFGSFVLYIAAFVLFIHQFYSD